MLKNDLNALIDPAFPKAPTALGQAPKREPITKVVARSEEVSAPPSEATGGEIGDEVFTEQSRQTVTYRVTSETDATIFFDVEAVIQLVMIEGAGRRVELNFEPPEESA